MTTNTAWHAEALNDLENTSMTAAEIATKYGRSRSAIDKLLFSSGVVRKFPNTRRGPKPRENRLPLSREHVALGIRLNMARGGEGIQTYADRLGVSPIVLAHMEAGQYDFQLSQILKISTLTGQPVGELVQTFEKNLYQGRTNARS
ncbi:hypothetical protein ACCS91_33675 [Rhizobium ruizarguesonis]|uniref:hypothetical protein n=1 Tax=Rhizobium ruizarguesonis TaxID=2081791 RepID=UPI001639BBAC|nr:hypothetical protein [Rhizobium ruizarguesonis]MBC2806615.1 hypothetical protein [Rhizobium ruizarguesonis]